MIFKLLSTMLIELQTKGIPPGARWTRIDRKLVNPEALEDQKERFEERLDCVIVLRVLTREEIQKLADKTAEIRGMHCVLSSLSTLSSVQHLLHLHESYADFP